MITGEFSLLAGNSPKSQLKPPPVNLRVMVQPSFIQRPKAEGGLPSETRLDFLAAFSRGKAMPGQTVPDLCPLCHVSRTLLYYFSGVSVKKWHTTFYNRL